MANVRLVDGQAICGLRGTWWNSAYKYHDRRSEMKTERSTDSEAEMGLMGRDIQEMEGKEERVSQG